MILVDTNVWSELMRAKPDSRVQAWEKGNAAELALATVVVGELLSGAHCFRKASANERCSTATKR